MAKGSNNLAERRSSSRNSKPYDANNSLVKKVATKVTNFMPQRSWISKWFNSSQDNGDILNNTENAEDVEEEAQKSPPLKRPRIRMDVTHPPGTFAIQPKNKSVLNKADPSKKQYSSHNDRTADFLEPMVAGPSGMGHLVSSTPAVQTHIRNPALRRSDLNSLVSTQNNGAANGADDNSESSESTSGCSSLIPQTNRQEAPSNTSYNSPFIDRKRFMEDKLNFTNHLQSPRSLFLDSNSRDTLSSRRPSFNASMMSNTLDRASSLSSPFYSGNITFGGANAAGLFKRSSTVSNSLNETKLRVPKRTKVEVQVSDTTEVDSSGMSQTAKKILEALEHFSSPISDAKKIPVRGISSTGTPLSGQKRSREEMAQSTSRVGLRHLTRELTVPTVPDMLKIRRRQKLQDTTVEARQIVSANSGPPPSPQEYRLGSDSSENTKYRGKLKVHGKKNIEEEGTVESVNLPNVTLPITSLPNFSFTLPQSTTTVTKDAPNKDVFKFASPIKLTNSTNDVQSINNFNFSKPINPKDKDTSVPSTASSLKAQNTEHKTTTSSTPAVNFIWSGSSTAPRPKEKAKCEDSSVKIASELSSGSVMDVLKNKSDKKGFSPSIEKSPVISKLSDSSLTNNHAGLKTTSTKQDASVWECSECLIKNSNFVSQCIACKASKSSSLKPQEKPLIPSTVNNVVTQSKPVVNDCFGSQFKVTPNNKEPVMLWSKQQNTTQAESGNTSSGFDKFKPAKDSWECPGCMLRNASTVITCPCCNASKPSSLKTGPKKDNDNIATSSNATSNAITSKTDLLTNKTAEIASSASNATQPEKSDLMQKFKVKGDTWECPSCMVRNNNSANVCPCCSAAKPGASSSSNSSTKVDSTPVVGFGDKFKKPEGSWSCDSCLVQNDGKATECVACGGLKPGTQKARESSTTTTSAGLKFSFGVPSNAGGFKFGIDKADSTPKTENISTTNGFKFGDNKSTGEAAKFTFGIPKAEPAAANVTELSKTVETTPGYQFSPPQSSGKVENKKKAEEVSQKPTPMFTFSAAKNTKPVKTSEKKDTNAAPQIATTANVNAATGGFKFVIEKPAVAQTEVGKGLQKAVFGNPKPEESKSEATPATTTAASISTLSTPSTTAEVKPLPKFSFGIPSTATTTSNASTSLPSQPSFAFPKMNSEGTSLLPAFGQTPSSTPATTTTPTFSFGSTKPVETSAEPLAKQPTPAFSVVAPVPSFSSASTPLFGSSEVKATSAFAATKNKTPAFGVPENKAPATFGAGETKPLFGAPETKIIPAFGSIEKPAAVPAAAPAPLNPTPNSTPRFGTSNSATLFGQTSTPVFGNNASAGFAATATPPSIFSSSKPGETNTPNPNLFTFGANRPAAQTSGGFNFTANSNPAPTAQKSFTFGSNANASQPSTVFGGSTFNAPPAPATSNFTFNEPKSEAPAFGQPAVAAALFGAPQNNPQGQSTSTFPSTTTPSAGFNFGSNAPAAPSGGFNFGAAAAAAKPSEGFNFTAPGSTPTPTFDPNTRPSFNFTGGSVPATFNATPQTSMPQRKIKKAVRRMRQDTQR